jgi:hypothetical protein
MGDIVIQPVGYMVVSYWLHDVMAYGLIGVICYRLGFRVFAFKT